MNETQRQAFVGRFFPVMTATLITVNAAFEFLIWLTLYKAQFRPVAGFPVYMQTTSLLMGVFCVSLFVYINKEAADLFQYGRKIHRILYGLSFVVPIVGIHLGYLSLFQ